MIPLLLVRHGQSVANLERRLCGQTDVELTDLGRRQACEAAGQVVEMLAGRPSMLISSDLLRAQQTAELIAVRLGVQTKLEPALREQYFGTMENLPFDQLVPEHAAREHESEVRWGGGESLTDVQARLMPLLRRLSDDFDGPRPPAIVLVGHGNCLHVLLATLQGRSHREVAWGTIANAQVIPAELDAYLLPSVPPSRTHEAGR